MTIPVSQEDLLPCPFCGEAQDDFGGMTPNAFARCEDQFAVNCSCGAMGRFAPTLDLAVTAWNTRADTAHHRLRAIEEAAKVADAAQARHEATYADARKGGYEDVMDRCAARARSAGNIATAIRKLSQ